jgi:hypothetical protein
LWQQKKLNNSNSNKKGYDGGGGKAKKCPKLRDVIYRQTMWSKFCFQVANVADFANFV